MSQPEQATKIQLMIPEREKIREAIEKIKESSQNDYEKNIIYITAGTLVLSMTFIEKISPLSTALNIWMIVTSWSFLALSLAINLASHWYSAYSATKLQSLLNNLTVTFAEFNKKLVFFNNRVQVFNISTFVSMFLGIFFLVLYCSINAFNMSNLENKEGQTIPTNRDTIQKGRVFSPAADYTPITPQTPQPQAPAPAASTNPPATAPTSSDTSGS